MVLMTDLLKQAFDRVSRMDEQQQNDFAARWLAEMQDEAAWDQRFDQSAPQLSNWADHVREQIKLHHSVAKGIDEL